MRKYLASDGGVKKHDILELIAQSVQFDICTKKNQKFETARLLSYRAFPSKVNEESSCLSCTLCIRVPNSNVKQINVTTKTK